MAKGGKEQTGVADTKNESKTKSGKSDEKSCSTTAGSVVNTNSGIGKAARVAQGVAVQGPRRRAIMVSCGTMSVLYLTMFPN